MERPTLRQLEYAVAVADAGHFGRGAAGAEVSQPGLSGQVKELERRLGVRLFERSRRGVRVTAEGAEVIGRARAILQAVDDLRAAAGAGAGRGPRGDVRIAAIPTIAPYLLPRLLPHMRSSWPDAQLVIHEQRSAAIVDGVGNGTLDLGVLALPYEVAGLSVAPIGHEDFWLAVPVGHELDCDRPLAVADLRGRPLLLLEDGHCLRDHALSVCELAGGADHSEVRSASLSTITQMVAGGTASTLLPAGAVAVECRAGSGVRARPFREPAPGREVALLWRPSDPRGGAFSALAGLLVEAGVVTS